jgi:hypothetical protein
MIVAFIVRRDKSEGDNTMRRVFLYTAVQATMGIIAGLLCATVGGFIGFQAYKNSGDEFAGLGELICGAMLGYFVGVPLGVWATSRLLNLKGLRILLGIVSSYLLSWVLVFIWIRLLELTSSPW